jgi:hypothetical protein
MQDQWAQIVERLGDTWGRQIRYGGDPPNPDHELVPGFSRSELWEMIKNTGEWIDLTEREVAALALEDAQHDDDRLIELETLKRQLEEQMQAIGRVVVHGRI